MEHRTGAQERTAEVLPRLEGRLQPFLFWSVAFYATALGYVFDARGENVYALVAIFVAVAFLAPVVATAARRRLGR